MWERGLTTGTRLDWKRVAVAGLSVFVLGCVAAGCGGSGAKENSEVTITVASRGYPEEEVLREIYAHALEAAGFEVARRFKRGFLPLGKLRLDQVSGYPEHLDSALFEASVEPEDAPAQAKAAYKEVQEQFEENDFVPFPPTAFGRPKVIAIAMKTAEERGIETLADLKKSSHQMSVAVNERSLNCYAPVGCLGDFQSKYGIEFGTYSVIESTPRLYKALRAGRTGAALLYATDGHLAVGKDWLVLLEDDDHRLAAANAFWLTSQDVVEEAGPDYEKAILKAQKGLTLEIMRKLNAKVELDGEPPGKVAAEYLKSLR